MRGSQTAISFGKCVALLLAPAPVAVLVSHFILSQSNPRWWQATYNFLVDFYATIGFLGVFYIFSWPQATLHILPFGLPYAIFALLMKWLLFRRRGCRIDEWNVKSSLGKWSAVLFLPAPLALLLVWGIANVSPHVLEIGLKSGVSEIEGYWRLMISRTIIYGVPYCAICLALQSLLLGTGKADRGGGA